MLEQFVFIGIAYLALLVGIVGSIYRLRAERRSAAARVPQIVAAHALLWEGIPWHLGIVVILLTHLVVLVFPVPWQRLVSSTLALWLIEGAGLALAIVALLGLAQLLLRGLSTPRVRALLRAPDICLCVLLLWQTATGIGMAIRYHGGAAWATGTVVPYIYSLLMLHPTTADIVNLPPLALAHIAGAWITLLLLPFSRLFVLFVLPAPARPAPARATETDLARRNVLIGTAGIIGGSVLLTLGGLDALIRYLLGPRLTREQSVTLDEERLLRLQQTTEERDLVLQREREDYLPVAAVRELNRTVGKYFTDYQMFPALAFLGKDGFPLLISAKCTHLGCTVGNIVNAKNQLLCPCHISYFDVDTGIPTPASPAKLPLPHIGWVLTDPRGREIARQTPDGRRTGSATPQQVRAAYVFIAKSLAGGA